MTASRRLAFIYLNSSQSAATTAAESSAAAPGPAGMHRRAWVRRIAAWLVGGLAGGPVGESDPLGEIPRRYLANNHLRRDIGLPPVLPDGWPH
jgi:hypothetical protein